MDEELCWGSMSLVKKNGSVSQRQWPQGSSGEDWVGAPPWTRSMRRIEGQAGSQGA